jgi:DNA-cytosine methyltransferase
MTSPGPERPRGAALRRPDGRALVAIGGREDALPREFDLLVGGFPCQDYSVAKPLSQAQGLGGGKGILWWEIARILQQYRPPHVLLENVDRLLKSPSTQRGRDFAVMLACFAQLGYAVEWRVVNAEDYGYPQRRRRVFLYATRQPSSSPSWARWPTTSRIDPRRWAQGSRTSAPAGRRHRRAGGALECRPG